MFLKLKRYVLTLERTKDAPNQSILKENQWRGQKHNKYFGVVFDSKLNWKQNINSVLKKVNLKMHCSRKLRFFGVNSDIC